VKWAKEGMVDQALEGSEKESVLQSRGEFMMWDLGETGGMGRRFE
jgi:hypothetical protein